MKLSRIVGLLGLALFSFSLWSSELQVIYTCDLHGELPRFAEIAPHIRAGKSDALRIDGGDLVSGNCFAEYCAGQSMIEAFNLLNYDVWVPGNHEFELGYTSFLRCVQNFRGAVLGADWHWDKIVPRRWQMFEREGVKIAVIGLGDPKMPRRLLPDCTARFTPPAVALQQALRELKKLRPEVIILVWHHGVYYPPYLGDLLRRHPEIDLALAAHTHEEIPGKRYGHTWVVQAGSHARCVADIRINFDEKRRRVVKITSRLRRPCHSHPDSELMDCFRRHLKPLKHQLYRSHPEFPRPFRRPHRGEYSAVIGRYAAQKVQEVAQSEAAVVLLPEGRFKKEAARNLRSLHGIMPYRNMLFVANLQSQEVAALVEWCEKTGKKMHQVPFYAGIRFQRTPAGKLKNLELPEQLTVALNNYLLVAVPELKNVLVQRRYRPLNIVEREALLSRKLLE